jgi:4-amino-4-deoxy-L-arabinose transferase-like glycosyltransferase
MLPRLKLPPPPAALALLAAAFLLPGLAGHDPWKSLDAVHLGIAHAMAGGGGLLVPQVAGARWLAEPPLYHWVAAALGRLLQFALEFHAGARLASALFVAAAFWFAWRAARDGAPRENAKVAGAAAFLILLGSVGLMVHAHEALPELASLAAVGAALGCLPHAARRPLAAGAGFGAALGLAFLAAGWVAPTALALAVAAAHLACRPWRTRRGAAFLAVSLVVALAVGGAWIAALAWQAPDALREWAALAFTPQGSIGANLRQVAATTGWLAWPAWPLALWSLWSLRRRWSEPLLFAPALGALAILVLQACWGPAQENLLPALAPLALVAAQGVFTLRRGATGALDWFGVLTFGVFAALVWLGWLALMTGFPPRIEYNLMRIAPGFVPRVSFLPVAFAAALAALWLYVVFGTSPSPMRSVTRWAAGMTLLWGTFSMLLMPWADYQKSYRGVALQLRSRLPVGADCVAQKSLGVSQAAALDYHAGIRTRPYDLLKPGTCRLLLVQGTPKHELDAPAPVGAARWVKLADVGRPGDRSERYRLYKLDR